MDKGSKIMVCVTRQKTCERLINIGQKIASQNAAELYVLHVAKEGVNFLGNPDEGEALEYLFQISKRASASMSVLRSHDVVQTLQDFALKNDISLVVVGESPYSKAENNIIRKLQNNLPSVQFKIVPAE